MLQCRMQWSKYTFVFGFTSGNRKNGNITQCTIILSNNEGCSYAYEPAGSVRKTGTGTY